MGSNQNNSLTEKFSTSGPLEFFNGFISSIEARHRGLRPHIFFCLPPLIVPPWPVLTECDHGQVVALFDRLSHTASSFIARRLHSWSWTATIHRVLYCTARRDGDRLAAQFLYGFLSFSLNLEQCARGWPSAHISKASYIEAVHEPHQHLGSFARCSQVPQSSSRWKSFPL